MNYRRLLLFVSRCAGILLLVGCSLDAPQTPQPVNRQTALALTPSPTLTPAPTATVTATATSEPTATSTPEASETAAPAETAPAASASAQSLADVSFCRRSFGPVNGARFSARLESVSASQTDDFDQLRFVFADTTGALHGSAGCMLAAGWPRDADYGSAEVPGDALIAVDLDQWAHDELFAASPLTETVEITTGGLLERVSFAAHALDSRGALLGVGLREPRPFRVRVQSNELIVEVARDGAVPATEDPLGEAAGDPPQFDQPVFFLQNGDVYRLQGGQARPVAETPELETSVAVSPDGSLLAVCRAPADTEPFALPYAVRATLWVLRADGSDAQQLADVGGCADPAFAVSGKTIAFTANDAPAPPAVLRVWTVPVVGGDAVAAAPLDEWSRSQPRWLDDGRLLYLASNGGQAVILLRGIDGAESELTARILTDATYRGVGQFIVDGANNQIALEALRAADDGADLVVLRADGTPVAVEQRGFWQRPLAFTSEGLVYLTAECPSESVLQYTVHRRPAGGSVETLVSGSTAAGIGSATVQGGAVIYTRAATDAAGVRGPVLEPGSADRSSIWAMSLDGAVRAELYNAGSGITGLRAAAP